MTIRNPRPSRTWAAMVRPPPALQPKAVAGRPRRPAGWSGPRWRARRTGRLRGPRGEKCGRYGATRFGIYAGGVASMTDPRYTVLPQRERLDQGRPARAGDTRPDRQGGPMAQKQ